MPSLSATAALPRRSRAVVAAGVLLLHGMAIVVLLRAFAPALPVQVMRAAGSLVSVRIAPSPPRPPPPSSPPSSPAKVAPSPMRAERHAPAASGKAAPRAVPRAAIAPPLAVAAIAASTIVVATGEAQDVGAGDAGSGTGSGARGPGSGAGGSGRGDGGGGGASGPVKIAGDINAARDFPAATRALRLGDYVVVALSVGRDGTVASCRVVRPSRDAAADAITCRLASQRFRFRPARDAGGNPVAGVYGWRQRWFSPAPK